MHSCSRITSEAEWKLFRIRLGRNFCNIYNNLVNSIFWPLLVIYIQQRKTDQNSKTYSRQQQISIH